MGWPACPVPRRPGTEIRMRAAIPNPRDGPRTRADPPRSRSRRRPRCRRCAGKRRVRPAGRDASFRVLRSSRVAAPRFIKPIAALARHGDRRRDHRQRRLPGQPPALLRRDRRAGDRHDLSRLSVRPAVRGPAVRDVLRLRRSRLPDPGGPARRPPQQRPPFADERDQPGDGSRAGKDLAVSFIGGPPHRDGLMRARNRELIGLIPASLLVTAGFAGVFIQRRTRSRTSR